jgi:glucosamine-6-phosphate deaminase
MEVIIQPDPAAVSEQAAHLFARQIREKPGSVLGLATGSTPVGLYRRLIELHRSGGINFEGVTTFNLDEYVGLGRDHPQSYACFMREHLFAHVNVDPGKIHIPDGLATDIPAHCAAYETAIRDAGGIDLQLLGLGADGHIGFNEPSSSLSSRTRLKTLTGRTIADNARFFSNPSEVPRHVITMGVGTIMDARQILLLVTGERKAAAVRATVEGPITASVPASILQMHERCTLITDEAAACSLVRAEYYRWVFDNKPEWQRA